METRSRGSAAAEDSRGRPETPPGGGRGRTVVSVRLKRETVLRLLRGEDLN